MDETERDDLYTAYKMIHDLTRVVKVLVERLHAAEGHDDSEGQCFTGACETLWYQESL